MMALYPQTFPQLYEEAVEKGLQLSNMSRMHAIKAAVVMQDLPAAMELLGKWLDAARRSDIPLEAMDAVVCLAERQGDGAALEKLSKQLQLSLGSRAKVRVCVGCVCKNIVFCAGGAVAFSTVEPVGREIFCPLPRAGSFIVLDRNAFV